LPQTSVRSLNISATSLPIYDHLFGVARLFGCETIAAQGKLHCTLIAERQNNIGCRVGLFLQIATENQRRVGV
jgi:hypothetical protein